MRLYKMKDIFTIERLMIAFFSIVIAIGFALPLISIFSKTSIDDENFNDKMVFIAFTDYYSDIPSSTIKSAIGMAFIGGFSTIALNIVATVVFVRKLKEMKLKREWYISPWEALTMFIIGGIIIGLAVAAMSSLMNLASDSWVQTELANSFIKFPVVV